MDLFELLKSQVSESALSALAGSLGETPSATRKAVIGGAVPAVLAGLVQNFSQEASAGRLLDLLQAGRHDGSLFDNLGGALGAGAQSDTLINLGKGLLGNLLGDKAGPVTDLLANFAGVRRSSAGSLLSIAAPLVLGGVGRLAGAAPGGLTAASVGGVLAAAKAGLAGEAPPGLAAALGVADLAGLGAVTSERRGAVYPWLLVPVAAMALFLVLRSCSQRPAEAIPASQGQVVAPIPPAAEPAEVAAPAAETAAPATQPAK
jgi:hypothetical protein